MRPRGFAQTFVSSGRAVRSRGTNGQAGRARRESSTNERISPAASASSDSGAKSSVSPLLESFALPRTSSPAALTP